MSRTAALGAVLRRLAGRSGGGDSRRYVFEGAWTTIKEDFNVSGSFNGAESFRFETMGAAS